mmetsp:Transcript_32004/g.105950  ORF Transcript_32004/g.105950 Transcript_32004/m.105950 type:complete len:243 (+) Transcript_32004:708-1436(+)
MVMPRTARAHLLLSEQVGSCSIWTWSRSDPLDASHRSFINHNQLSIRNQVVLRSLDAYRRCAADAVVGWGPQLSPRGGQVSSGVLIGRPDAHFYASWRRRLLRGYDAGRTDFGRSCNVSTELALSRPRLVHAAPELGPLPRFASRELYDGYLEQAPLAHLSAFRHGWRLRDLMVHRSLEKIAALVLAAANRSLSDAVTRGTDAGGGAAPEAASRTTQLRECVRTMQEACWARPGGRCGIYGA